ncbi:hypothetical protein M426DRAFT_320745 [Hypoxylon sp. CI-4A]|nr:hypothetical protein M426DRAFT_320745 [Hypoxylon sp. CI-4A]
MPPKRTASTSNVPASKRAKTPSDEPPRNKRWSAVSASANADADYKTTWKNPDKWYSYVTICCPIRSSSEDDDEDEDEDEDDDDDDDGDDNDKKKGKDVDDDDAEDEDRSGPGCGEKNCVCLKPPAENPEHPWLVSQAGYRKYRTQHIYFSLRDPDSFGMYTSNDHLGYGCVEMLQNLFLDYVEAAERGWREQWAICEGLILWLFNPSSDVMLMIDHAELVRDTMQMVGRMFLDMLAKLDNRNLVGDATDVKNLGTIMAMYIKLPPKVRPMGVLDEEPDDDDEKEEFHPDRFDDAILSYANRRGVTLQGPGDIDKLTANLTGEVQLPKKGVKDPWNWEDELKEYTKHYGKGKQPKIGGDDYDITTWTSAQRKKASFTHKDPLGKRELDAIKQGMVMQQG